MSASIGEFTKITQDSRASGNLHLQAFVGPEGSRMCIQFTIGNEYFCMEESQLKTLRNIIDARLTGAISATGFDYDLDLNNGMRVTVVENDNK